MVASGGSGVQTPASEDEVDASSPGAGAVRPPSPVPESLSMLPSLTPPPHAAVAASITKLIVIAVFIREPPPTRFVAGDESVAEDASVREFHARTKRVVAQRAVRRKTSRLGAAGARWSGHR